MTMRAAGSLALALVAALGVAACGGAASTPRPPPSTGGESQPNAGAESFGTKSCAGRVGREFTGCLAEKLTMGKYGDVIAACRDHATTSQGNNAIACVTLLPAAFYLSRRTTDATRLLTRACRDLDPEKKTMLAATCVYTTAISLRSQTMADEDRKQTIAGAAQAFAAACDSDPNDVIKQAAEMDRRARAAGE